MTTCVPIVGLMETCRYRCSFVHKTTPLLLRVGCVLSYAQFTPPARHDKTVVLSVSCQAVWIESRDRLVKPEQLADRPPSSRRVYCLAKKFRFSRMRQSTACLHFAWRTTSLRVADGRLGVAACLACVTAAAVDRQARQSCRVWCGGVNWIGPTARQVRSASECVRRSHRQCLRRPTHSDAERTCRAVGLTQFAPLHQTRQDGPVSVVSGVPMWIGRLPRTCSDFKFSAGDSLELSGIQFTPPKRTRQRQDSFVMSGVRVWISF